MRPRTFTTRLGLLVAGALAVRLFYALGIMGAHPVTGDGREFHYLAQVLASEHRYLQPFRFLFAHGTMVPTAEKPPLYPLALAVPSALGWGSYAAHRVAACLMGAATVGVVGLLGRRVGGERTGLVAAAIAAVYPMLVMLDAAVRSESLYALLVALVLLAAYRLLDVPRLAQALVLGALVGLAALTRSEALALLLLLAAPLLALLPRGRRLRAGVAILAGCAVVVGPWLGRNWLTFERPTTISTNEGGLLAGANCAPAYYSPLIGSWPCFPRNDPRWGENEAVISGHLRARALAYARDHAGRVPAVVGARVLRVWDLYEPGAAARLEAGIGDRPLRGEQIGVAVYYGLVAFAAVGAVALRRRRTPLRILLAPMVLVTLVAAATYGSTRFRVAAEVPLVVLGAVAVSALVDRRRRGGSAPSTRASPDVGDRSQTSHEPTGAVT